MWVDLNETTLLKEILNNNNNNNSLSCMIFIHICQNFDNQEKIMTKEF